MRLLRAFLNVNVPIQGSTAYHYPGAGHSWCQKFLPKLTITAEIARHFWDFSSVPGKMQFCRGGGLEEQLQLIAASESHLSFIFAICRQILHPTASQPKLAEEKTGKAWPLLNNLQKFFFIDKAQLFPFQNLCKRVKDLCSGQSLDRVIK